MASLPAAEESLDGFTDSSEGGFQWIDANKTRGCAGGTFFVGRLWGGRRPFLG
jgi:hypothetical protein